MTLALMLANGLLDSREQAFAGSMFHIISIEITVPKLELLFLSNLLRVHQHYDAETQKNGVCCPCGNNRWQHFPVAQ
jgi:hypothetical protein